jgi:hypothetical protein
MDNLNEQTAFCLPAAGRRKFRCWGDTGIRNNRRGWKIIKDVMETRAFKANLKSIRCRSHRWAGRNEQRQRVNGTRPDIDQLKRLSCRELYSADFRRSEARSLKSNATASTQNLSTTMDCWMRDRNRHRNWPVLPYEQRYQIVIALFRS